MPLWLAYLLGFLTWLPMTVCAVLAGRWLARSREIEAGPRPFAGEGPVLDLTAQAVTPVHDRPDDWAKAWAEAFG